LLRKTAENYRLLVEAGSMLHLKEVVESGFNVLEMMILM